MGLNLAKLENVKRRGSNTIARCPACAESEGDCKGEHLFINDKGQFGCVLYPGVDGKVHRQRIFELVGVKETHSKGFEVRRPISSPTPDSAVIQKDILGHTHTTHTRKSLNIPINKSEDNLRRDFKKPPRVSQSPQRILEERLDSRRRRTITRGNKS